jgi:hypothetical protein
MNQSNAKKIFNFIIRDDDLCFFTKPEHLLAIYAEVFAQNIPVSFSTIPFVTLPSDAWLPRPLPVTSDTGQYAVSNNKDLVEYIKSNPLIEITLHGCTHQTIEGVFEYTQKKGLFEATLKGKQELEKAFAQPVSVFVAPHDQFSNHGILAIENAGLNILRGKGTKNFIPRISYIDAIVKTGLHWLRYAVAGISRSEMPAYPHLIDLGSHQEAFGIRIESKRESLFAALRLAHKTRGNFILVNHMHEFDESRKKLMLELISEAQRLGANFVRAGDLFHANL